MKKAKRRFLPKKPQKCEKKASLFGLGLVGVGVVWTMVHAFLYLCEAKITKTAVLLEEVKASHKPEWHLPIRSILSFPSLGVFFMPVCLSCRSEIAMKGNMRVGFVSRRKGLIAWLRESTSRRNPSSRSDPSWKVEEKLCSLSPHVSRPGKAFIDKVGI